jgi:hypothetical protein
MEGGFYNVATLLKKTEKLFSKREERR